MMYQVDTGAYVSLLALGKTDYTACHPRRGTRYMLMSTYWYRRIWNWRMYGGVCLLTNYA